MTHVERPTSSNDISIQKALQFDQRVFYILMAVYLSGVLIGIYLNIFRWHHWIIVAINTTNFLLVITLIIGQKAFKISNVSIVAVACYGGLLCFQTEIPYAIFLGDQNYAAKIMTILFASSIFLSVAGFVVDRKLSVIFGGITVSMYVWASIAANDPFLNEYLILFTGTTIGYMFIIYIYKGDIEKILIRLHQLKRSLPVLDLQEKRITSLEYVCIQYLLENRKTKEIAGIENVSESAIQARIRSIYQKLHVSDRAELMKFLGGHIVVYGNSSEVLSIDYSNLAMEAQRPPIS